MSTRVASASSAFSTASRMAFGKAVVGLAGKLWKKSRARHVLERHRAADGAGGPTSRSRASALSRLLGIGGGVHVPELELPGRATGSVLETRDRATQVLVLDIDAEPAAAALPRPQRR